MPRPRNIYPEAVVLLERAGWAWCDFGLGFLKSWDQEQQTLGEYRSRPPLRISYVEIKNHHLVGSRSTTEERETGLKWLRRALSASS